MVLVIHKKDSQDEEHCIIGVASGSGKAYDLLKEYYGEFKSYHSMIYETLILSGQERLRYLTIQIPHIRFLFGQNGLRLIKYNE